MICSNVYDHQTINCPNRTVLRESAYIEFSGGRLTFVPADTTKNKKIIRYGNIKFIFAFNARIYFIEVNGGPGFSDGALYELDTTNNNFACKRILDFEDAPEAYTVYNDKIFIASHENFYVVKDFTKRLIFKDTFWSSLYPNSIAVIDEKNVFLGIRGGIVKLDLMTAVIKFYKYAK